MALLVCSWSAHAADDPRPLPVGLDAYRAWDRWPDQRIGMRAYMQSTYDRRGGNEGADASHFLYQLSDDFNVTLDLEGPGILVFSRYNHWHGGPWHYVVDSTDHLIQETSTSDPLHPSADSSFLPADPFPAPLNETWATTRGADIIWSPIAFERSLRMAYTRTHYGTGYYIYDRFVAGTPLSRPLSSWNEGVIPERDVLELISRSGSDVAPETGAKDTAGKLAIPATGVVRVHDIKGQGAIRALSFSLPQDQAAAFQRVRLRVTWDGREQSSIDAPIALFYGAGSLFNRDHREYLVKAFPVSIRFSGNRIYFACYFPMPFFRSARIELVSGGEAIDGVEWQVRSVPSREAPESTCLFSCKLPRHAQPSAR